MKLVTKYAMLVLLTTSFIALNNCGSHSASEPEYSAKENGPASDYAAILGAPLVGYPNLVPGLAEELPLVSVEIDCNNGVDDDGDGLEDCYDNDCHVHPECSQWGPPLEELINERSLVVYPNGLIVPEDIALQKARGADDDDLSNGWLNNQFFATGQKDCWVTPREMDPYWNIPLGEALVAGPLGPIGPQLFPNSAVAFYGPRAGLINECEDGADLMWHHADDDNGAGAGAGGDSDDEEGGEGSDDGNT